MIVIDINTADADTLQLIEGVGPARARAIVADWAQRGPFCVVLELVRVDGVGVYTVESNEMQLTIGDELPAACRPDQITSNNQGRATDGNRDPNLLRHD